MKLTSTPDEELDSTSYLIKTFFDDFANEEMKPKSFKYMTQVDDEKLLVLLKIPWLKNLADDQKPMLVDMVNQLIDVSPNIMEKERKIYRYKR